MLGIRTERDGAELRMYLSGRLDTGTAPELESSLRESLDGVDELVLDLKELVYVSSAGLRVLLSAQKVMGPRGGMVVCNVNNDVQDVFDMTGFSDFLTIV
ncbi:MAG: STAS domain-containing protein [Atopobiaceae bacterium]|nr:STAS domain-containing protein [Atopobiaceae bacterium]